VELKHKLLPLFKYVTLYAVTHHKRRGGIQDLILIRLGFSKGVFDVHSKFFTG
jgi:hypothetical protein